MRNNSGSDQDKVVAEAVVECGQSASIFESEPSVLPGGIKVGDKMKGKPRIMPRFGSYTTGRMELPSTWMSTKTITSAIKVSKRGPRDKA